MTLVCIRVLLVMLHCPYLGSGVQTVPAFGTRTSNGCYPSRYHSVLVGAAQEDLAVRALHVHGVGTRGKLPADNIVPF